MKRYRYVVAATCLLLSAAGFIGLYATNHTDEEEQAKNQNIVEESEDIILGSNLFDTESEKFEPDENLMAGIDEDADIQEEQEMPTEQDKQQEIAQQDPVENEAPVGNVTQETLHFNPENGLVWPIEGTVLLDYSMDSTIFFW